MSGERMITSETLARSLSDSIASMIDQEIRAALDGAALIADQVGAKARPGDGKETADEIGRRIRALKDGTR